MPALPPKITLPEGSPLAEAATRELTSHLARLDTHGLTHIEITHGPSGEGFDWSHANGAIAITADGAEVLTAR